MTSPNPESATGAAEASPVPSPLLVGAALVCMLASLYGAFLYAPTDRVQGDVQRLFYMHVPAALTMYVAILVVFVASLRYLQTRDARWDEIAAAGGEVGLLFGTMVMVTGPMWARPVWGAWWTWDARLTSFFLLWLIFVAYVMLRTYGGAPDQVARFCAVLGILGFVGMPITHYTVQWFRTMHPEPVIMTENGLGGGLENAPGMLPAFAMGLVAAVMLFAAIFPLRLRLERQERRVQEMRRRLDIAEISR
ncbi:MAG: cytochrome c biogenesis protein CcsA [Acidobacteriota bacterium]